MATAALVPPRAIMATTTEMTPVVVCIHSRNVRSFDSVLDLPLRGPSGIPPEDGPSRGPAIRLFPVQAALAHDAMGLIPALRGEIAVHQSPDERADQDRDADQEERQDPAEHIQPEDGNPTTRAPVDD